MYDVFLSHNRKQKPWVRHLHQFLKGRGISVFFDEEDIPPGANIVSSIENALEKAQHVLLVLSPDSLASEWAAMETHITVYQDPSAKRGTLVPIIVEPIYFKDLRPSVRALNCVDLTNAAIREQRLRFLLKHIGVTDADEIPQSDLAQLLSMENDLNSSPIVVAGLEKVIEWGWSGERLLEELIRIDYLTLAGLVSAHEGSPGQWAPIFMNHPETWRMLVYGKGKIAGYWHFAPLFPEAYQQAKRGVFRDSEITPDQVMFFEMPGVYDLYFVQVCLLPQFRGLRNTKLLFQSIFSVLETLAEEGIFIREICANAYTEVGNALCKSFKLTYLCEHNEHGSIYCGSILDVIKAPVAQKFSRLLEIYQ